MTETVDEGVEDLLVDGELVYYDVDELVPHEKNYRRGDVDAIRESIRENRFYGLVYVQRPRGRRKHPRIVAHEHAWKAAKLEGVPRVPCWVLSISDAEADRILAVDNLSSDRAENDSKALAALLGPIAGDDRDVWEDRLAGTGASIEFYEALLGDLEPPDFEPVDPSGQPRLDRKNPVTCPECGHEWVP